MTPFRIPNLTVVKPFYGQVVKSYFKKQSYNIKIDQG